MKARGNLGAGRYCKWTKTAYGLQRSAAGLIYKVFDIMANIILAEDDGSLRQFIAAALERAGHRVTPCADGLDALDKLRVSPLSFQLLLTDIVMPGMDGIELARLAGALNPVLKIMFITGFAGMAIEEGAGGGTKLISKPFHLASLVTEVEKILGSAA